MYELLVESALTLITKPTQSILSTPPRTRTTHTPKPTNPLLNPHTRAQNLIKRRPKPLQLPSYIIEPRRPRLENGPQLRGDALLGLAQVVEEEALDGVDVAGSGEAGGDCAGEFYVGC